MIAPEAGLSVSRQCALLAVARSSFYYRPRPESAEELELLKRLSEALARFGKPGIFNTDQSLPSRKRGARNSPVMSSPRC